jgi:farnesyl-diphosphate farnesyltransferase
MTDALWAQAPKVETPSGKVKEDENFPVGSFLIAKKLRPHVHAYYDFARAADDIADNPALPPQEKIDRLSLMASVLQGDKSAGAPSAVKLRASLRQTGVTPKHALDLLVAFKQDAVKQRYESWDELYEYCRFSAMPVGRYVLDLHGESHATWDASDALCSSLQVLNHLQDCGKDLAAMDRCYLPERILYRHNARVDDLRRPALTPGLRATIDELLVEVARLNGIARQLPVRTVSKRLRVETGSIVSLAERLTGHLRVGDPLASRVKLSKGDFVFSLLGSLKWLF